MAEQHNEPADPPGLSAGDLQRAISILARAERIVALTGAGVSAESGVPTFRGSGGLWEGKRPEQLASPEAFADDPEQVWRFYNWRRELLLKCQPNMAHRCLADLEAAGRLQAVITQNVDGLHQLAGSRQVVELHGNIWRVCCTGCRQVMDAYGRKLSDLPKCDDCGSLLRPDVVWFGEPLPAEALAEAEALARRCDLMLVIGTSAVVYPAAALPLLARQGGAAVVEINPEPTPLSEQADLCLRGQAGRILPLLCDVLLSG